MEINNKFKKEYVLRVEYGTGKANMITECPELIDALKEFLDEYGKGIPNSKMYGLPRIISAELLPLMSRSKSK